jgi:hypothetical protein
MSWNNLLEFRFSTDAGKRSNRSGNNACAQAGNCCPANNTPPHILWSSALNSDGFSRPLVRSLSREFSIRRRAQPSDTRRSYEFTDEFLISSGGHGDVS